MFTRIINKQLWLIGWARLGAPVLTLTCALLPGPTLAADACPELSTAQKIAGYLSWTGTLEVAGSACLAAGLLFVFSGLIRELLLQVELIEFLAWACAVGGVLSGLVLPPAIAQWSVYAGSAMFAGALAFSGKVRGRPFLSERFWGVLTVAWAVVAIAYQFSGVGFLAVLALVNFLGVGITVHPFCYVFGFKDEDRLAQATAGGCIITSAYAMAAAAGANLGVFEVFRSGALSLGSFTWFLGLLIITSKWYRKANAGYAWRQAIAVVSFSLAISIGLIFGLRELAAIATAFLLFYLAAKLIEIPTQNYIAFGLKLMAGGGVLFGAWTWLQNHQELALKYFAG